MVVPRRAMALHFVRAPPASTALTLRRALKAPGGLWYASSPGSLVGYSRTHSSPLLEEY
jgi:hypothetical protein